MLDNYRYNVNSNDNRNNEKNNIGIIKNNKNI